MQVSGSDPVHPGRARGPRRVADEAQRRPRPQGRRTSPDRVSS